jgi:carboxyl-terminal processing protease
MTPERRHPVLLATLIVALPVLLVVAGIWWGGHPQHLPGFLQGLVADSDTRVVNQALDDIRADYYRPVRRSELVDASIAGMVVDLHDRFSSYFTPSEYRQYTQESDARFSGVGMTVRPDPRGLRVLEVYNGAPAARAGIRSGDVVTAVGGRALLGVRESDATARIKGRPGTQVTLTVRRGALTFTRRLIRATVSVPVVASHMRTMHGVKLVDVALATFSNGVHGQVRQAIDRALRAGARGVVLDLRHNGGGLVEEARLVASIFLPDGTIVTTRGRSQAATTLTAAGDAIPPKVAVVVLVDGQTASASEIVAAALQDHGRATVVGARTFGKGVFQEVKPLSNGGALDLTVGEYFTPKGRNLGGGGIRRGAGITPDVRDVDNPNTSRDEVLDTAFSVLAGKATGAPGPAAAGARAGKR